MGIKEAVKPELLTSLYVVRGYVQDVALLAVRVAKAVPDSTRRCDALDSRFPDLVQYTSLIAELLCQ